MSEHTKLSAPERSPARILTTAVLLTGAVFLWFGWNIYNSYHVTSVIRDLHFQVQELQGVITHLDEVLTMSARMAAATGDLAWERRYLQSEPILDDTIKRVIKLVPSAYSGEGATETDAANVKLVEMEHRAFDLVRQNRKEEARDLLLSKEYQAQKQIYSRGTTRVAGLLRKNARGMLESEQKKARLNSFAIVVALPTLLIGWLFGLRTLHRWRIRLTEVNRRLDHQANELAELNVSLDKRVMQRTTQLEEAHLAELKQKEILQRIFDYIPVMTFLSDATGKVKMLNREFEHVLGWSLEEFHNTSHLINCCADENSRDRATSHLQDASGEWLDFSVLTRAGGVLDTSWASIRLSDGSIIGIGQNISDRKRTEAELARAKDIAEAANLAKSEFLAHMSHEIRTPMNAIIGMAELLSESALTPEQEEYVRIFRRAGDNLLNIINDILDLSKVEAGLLELEQAEFDLNEVVERTAEFLSQRAHQKDLDLTCHIKPDVPLFLIGDAPRLRQILINLLGNAIKFIEAGEIVLRVENDPASAEPGALLFAVSDTGIGIAPDKLTDIFESFKQADSTITRRFEGTGLGLSISRRLVGLMGGKIWVESQVGHGSTFYFTARFEPQAEQKPRLTAPVALRGLRALIIDDNATNRFILYETLASWGFSVATAESGAQGLAELKRSIDSGTPYQLLLLDCRMPGMDGFEVARAINKLALSLTTIMLTSDNRSQDIARSRDLGLRGYLVKPVKRNDLLEAVIYAMSRSQPHAAETEPTAEPAPVAIERSGRILLAEDNEDNRTLILAYLKNTPCQIDIAENGLTALEKFKTQGQYDLVLMDMQMPLMDGYTATREIRKWEARERTKATPIVALTAYALKEEAQKCIDAGCNCHVSKPIKKARLLETIEQYVHEEEVCASALLLTPY